METYLVLAFSFMKGLVELLLRSMMMSRKSIEVVLHSVVIVYSIFRIIHLTGWVLGSSDTPKKFSVKSIIYTTCKAK